MNYIQLTNENLEAEHICCAISSNNDVQVRSKKAWLAERFSEGLVFLKSEARGKCFIEYIPAENAWVPIVAEGYMYIDCLWVSGSLKGHGYSSELLAACVEDSKAKGRLGLCVLSSAKKRPFLSDPKYLKHKGFSVCDEAAGGVQLWYLPFSDGAGESNSGDGAEKPRFKDCARQPHAGESGYVLYYTDQCPFNAKYVPLVVKAAEEHGIPFRAIHLASREDAQNAPTPVTTYALFLDGEYLTNEQMNEAKFLKLAGRQILA
ncbi:MAG: YoaP domain-containing protein [Firmicutes bacterium]|nr:YoaP domain-containing protein [Bacillota bacterium]